METGIGVLDDMESKIVVLDDMESKTGKQVRIKYMIQTQSGEKNYDE